jgi:hypothetical protein
LILNTVATIDTGRMPVPQEHSRGRLCHMAHATFQQADCYHAGDLGWEAGGKTLKIFCDFSDFRRNTIVIETGGAKICTFVEMPGYKAGNRVPAAHGQFTAVALYERQMAKSLPPSA